MENDIAAMFNKNYDNEELFYKVTDYVTDKAIEDGIDKLSKIEKNFFMVGKVIMEINNGGFDQYFLNAEGVYVSDTLKFLNQIEEIYFSNLLEKAIAIYESHSSDGEKYDKFSELDSKFYEFDSIAYEELYSKCISYLKDNLE